MVCKEFPPLAFNIRQYTFPDRYATLRRESKVKVAPIQDISHH